MQLRGGLGEASPFLGKAMEGQNGAHLCPDSHCRWNGGLARELQQLGPNYNALCLGLASPIHKARGRAGPEMDPRLPGQGKGTLGAENRGRGRKGTGVFWNFCPPLPPFSLSLLTGPAFEWKPQMFCTH